MNDRLLINRSVFGFAMSALMLLGAIAVANETITLNFESETPGSTNTPPDWSMVVVSNTPVPTYITTNRVGGAGQVGRVTAFNASGLPGGYLVVNEVAGGAPFDLTKPISGSFDFYIAGGSAPNYKNVHFMMGDIESGITPSSPGQSLGARLTKTTFGDRAVLMNGAGTGLTSPKRLETDRWYAASFTWTPTNGLSGDFSFSVTGDHNWTLTHNGFTFGSEKAFFGFGTAGYYQSSNYGIGLFDNISITGSTISPAGPVVSIF
jgi:hypothetical protein